MEMFEETHKDKLSLIRLDMKEGRLWNEDR